MIKEGERRRARKLINDRFPPLYWADKRMGQKVLGAFVDSRVIEREKLLQDPTSGAFLGKGCREDTPQICPLLFVNIQTLPYLI